MLRVVRFNQVYMYTALQNKNTRSIKFHAVAAVVFFYPEQERRWFSRKLSMMRAKKLVGLYVTSSKLAVCVAVPLLMICPAFGTSITLLIHCKYMRVVTLERKYDTFSHLSNIQNKKNFIVTIKILIFDVYNIY